MYAIVESGGKQYKVSVGDTIRVEKIESNEGDKIILDKVLMFVDKDIKMGTPYITDSKVEATVVKNDKAKKVIVYRYKRKSGYHKKNGHRQPYTELKIDSIS
ncbi:MAG: 50S ribosomal protein L21 [Eubacteriales bacterium]|nr:50S ribosomal protein L21 [Eubacteriales bacterium]